MANMGGSGGGGNAAGVRAGRAYVEIGTDNSKLDSGLKAAERRLAAFGDLLGRGGLKLVGAGGAALTAVGLVAHEFIERGDKIKKASDRMGMSAEDVSLLGYAAEQSGTNLEGLEGGIKKMQKALVEAAEQGGETAEALRDIGIEASSLVSKTPTEQLFAIGDALEGIDNKAKRTQMAMKALGKGGTELVPLLMNGSKGLRKLMEEGKLAGALVTGKEAETAEKLGDAIQRTWTAAKYTVMAFGKALVPQAENIEELSFAVLRFLKGVREWIEENKALVATALIVSAATVAAGGVLIGLGLAAHFAALGVGLLGTSYTFTAGILAFFATPAGIALGTLLALGVAIGYLLVTTEKGQDVLRFFGNGWRELGTIFSTTWGAINDALASGDLETAGEIAMAGLEAVWLQGMVNLTKFGDDFLHHWVDGWKSADLVIKSGILDLVDWMTQTLVKGLATANAVIFEGLAAPFRALAAISSKLGDDRLANAIAGVGAPGSGTLAALGKQFADNAQAERNRLHKDAGVGQTPKSPDLIKAEAELAAAKARLDELAGNAAMNRILDEILQKRPDLGSPGGLGKGDLVRGVFGTRGFGGGQVFGQGSAFEQVPKLLRSLDQKASSIDEHLEKLLRKDTVFT